MIQTIRIAKTTLTLTLGVMFLAVVGGLIYLNQVGFPGRYGDWLRSELADKGVHLSFDTLRFDFERGLIATKVSIYEDRNHLRPLLKAEELDVDLDKTKALRGDLKLYKLRMSGGTARIPVDQDGRMVTAHKIEGQLIITESGRAVLNETSGVIEGIRIRLSADLKLPKVDSKALQPKQLESPKSNHVLGLVLDQLALWTLSPTAPPELTFTLKGDLNQSKYLQTSFSLKAEDLSKSDYRLDKITVKGDLRSEVVTIDQILLQDESGSATGQADWSIKRREGRFNLSSTLHLQNFLKSCFDQIVLNDLDLVEPPILKVNGVFSAPEDGPFSVRATGHGDIGQFHFKGSNFDKLSSDFSWQDGDLFLRDLKVLHKGKHLDGTLIMEGDLVHFDVQSTLPLKAFRPFIIKDGGLDRSLKNVTFFDNSIVALDVVGSLNKSKITDWSARGMAHLSNLSYKGTRIHHLASHYELKGGNAEFTEIKGLLNDENEEARTRFKGKPSEEIFADRIHHDPKTKLTTISNLRGKVWPTPIVRIFAPKVAEHIEKEYRFYKRPTITLNGRFAGTREDMAKTFFSVEALTEGQTDYPFLGYDLPLQNLKADLVVRGAQITVNNLSADTLDGAMSGSVFCDVTPGKKTEYHGKIKWDDISFRRLSQVYEFDEEEKGRLKGNIDFNGVAGGVRGFNATGMAALKGGNLVSLPILGPLSPLIAGLLGDKRMGYERAKDAAAPFAVKSGIFQTKDFTAISTSITLTGEGWIDLLTEDMDIIIRMNARGLLGFLTIPLKPLKGIFQFRGDGTFSDPKWKSAPFTKPSKGKEDPIFQQPGKALIIQE